MVTSSQLNFICTRSIFNSCNLKFYPSALAESIIFILKYNFKDENCLEHMGHNSWCCQIDSCKWGNDTSSQHEWRITWITAFGFMINIEATEKRAFILKEYFNGELYYMRRSLSSWVHRVCNRLSLDVEVTCSKEARQKFVCVNVMIIFAILIVSGKFFC